VDFDEVDVENRQMTNLASWLGRNEDVVAASFSQSFSTS
jgi:hypothetical protein